MNTLRKVCFRLVLDVELQVHPIRTTGPEVVDPDLAELCARVQATVLRNRALLDMQANLALSIFVDTLDRNKVKHMLGWDEFDPYQHPETLLKALTGADSQFLRTAQREQWLGRSLDDLTQSFRCEMTRATVQRAPR